MREGNADCTRCCRFSVLQRALVFKVGLLNAPAEGQQVAVALDPLCQLIAGQPGGQYGEEVTKDQRVQLSGPTTHRHTHTVRYCCNKTITDV